MPDGCSDKPIVIPPLGELKQRIITAHDELKSLQKLYRLAVAAHRAPLTAGSRQLEMSGHTPVAS
jgi:hypothetical protein